jgi:histidine ammonia-lyase
VGFAEEDRIFADDINKIKNIISDFSFVHQLNDYAAGKDILLNSGYDEFGTL